MRIGILTFHKAINYGAYLQAFSFSNKLKETFPDDEIEIIDYIAPKERMRKFKIILWNLKHYGIKGCISELKRNLIFNSMQKYLSLSPNSFCTNNLKKLYKYIENRYDMLIIGSDAVFNWNQTDFPTAFIPDYEFSIPVYTYAASVHGMKFYSVKKNKIDICSKIFERMTYVGTRDKCSEEFVKLCSQNAKIIHCCDPTLFIDKESIYEKGIIVSEKLDKRYGLSLKDKYIVVMAPDSELIKDIYKRYSKEYKIISVFVKSSFSDYYISDLNPFEWTVILKEASMVVTSYFHGTLLSLVQGTPAVVLDYSGYCDDKYEGKLKDLMITRLNLSELYFDKNDAENFVNKVEFYNIADELLDGRYQERINDAVEKEKSALLQFLDLLKSTDKK